MRLNKIIILNKNNFYFLIEFFKKKQIALSNVLLRIQFWIFNNATLLQKIGEIQFYFAKDPKKKTWEQWLLDADNSWILGVALIAYYAYPEIKEWWYSSEETSSTTTKQDLVVSKEVTSPQKQLDTIVVENSIKKDTPWCDFMEQLFL